MQIRIRPTLSALENMEADRLLLEECNGVYLEFHQWKKPSFTHGYFVDPAQEFVLSDGIDIARRSTGGGILYHGADLSFALVFPEGHPLGALETDALYQKLNQMMGRAILDVHPARVDRMEGGDFSFQEPFCLARPTKYDLVIQGKKVLGCAIRRKKGRVLYHCSIPLKPVSRDDLLPFLQRGTSIVEKILENTYAIGSDWNHLRERIEYHVTESGQKAGSLSTT